MERVGHFPFTHVECPTLSSLSVRKGQSRLELS
jgi:hypothetical protein